MTTAPSDPETQEQIQSTSSSGEFGTSEFGERLSYKSENEGCCKDWRDPFWAYFYYFHVILMLGLAIYGGVTLAENTSSSSSSSSGSSGSNTFDKIDLAVAVTLIACAVVGGLWGLLWLKIIQKFAESIIKGALFMVLICWIALAVFGVTQDGLIYVTVFAGFCALIHIIYCCCIWKRIPFSSALLKISSAITQTFEGTICISLIVIPFNIGWYFIWCYAFVGYLFGPSETRTGGIVYLIVFLYLVSFYWGIQVNRNISHTTTCGVTATWYFSKEIHKPTMPALKRTLTTSFGSVCLGSFIVAVLQALRTMLRSMKDSCGCLGCIIYCFLVCIENLVKLFNAYAFAQVAIYGSKFIDAAKATWNLFMAKGFTLLVNDDLTGLALFCGGILAFVVSFFTGYLLAPALLGINDSTTAIIFGILFGFVGAIIGYSICMSILQVVKSSVVALFVCFAEDPNAMNQNRPDEYQTLIGSRDELQTYAQTGHTGMEEQKK